MQGPEFSERCPNRGIISLLSVFTQCSTSFQSRSSIWFVDSQKSQNVIHLVFQSKPLKRSQLFLSLHVSCKRICPTPRANYSLFQDFFHCDLIFWRKHPPESGASSIVFILRRWQRALCCVWGRRNQTPFGPSSRPAQSSRSAPMGTHCSWYPFVWRFRPVLIIRPPRIQPNQYPLSFFILFFSSLWEGRWAFPQLTVTGTLETSTERHALLILKGSN